MILSEKCSEALQKTSFQEHSIPFHTY